MNLVIVESPTKAKTISKFLGKDYTVESSFGHVRDLPKSDMGVDIEHDFTPTYEVPEKAEARVKKLKSLAKKADAIYYATDSDREGEAIAWHIDSLLAPKKGAKTKQKKYRIVFHEITKAALEKALEHPGTINQELVDAQQARRVLDRLVGYKLSPFLWKKVMRGLSAGRVQSVAVRLIVEREKEIRAFEKKEYWTIEGHFKKQSQDTNPFSTALYSINNKKLGKFAIANKKKAKAIKEKLDALTYSIAEVTEKETKKRPYPPYRTSTLQQDAHNRLGYSSKQTMVIAQQLYEGVDLGKRGATGLITYMRTDSTIVSNNFIAQSKKYLEDTLGAKYSFEKPRIFKTKSKGAQEAHEAIRPTDVTLDPESVKPVLDPRQHKVYTLIWQRAVASLMPEATVLNTIVEIEGMKKNHDPALFRAIGSRITFDGFLKVYPIKVSENELPALSKSEPLDLEKIVSDQHFTQPPPRYNDASLVKELEKRGIGRPSTYAPTIDTIQRRGYVERDDQKRFEATDVGEIVDNVLEKHFPKIVDYDFTAQLENDLDAIAHDKKEWVSVIKNFYMPFAKNLEKKYDQVDKKKITQQETKTPCPKCKEHKLVIKLGRFGKFLACPGYPECKHTEPFEGKDGKSKKKEPTTNVPAPDCEDCKVKMIVKQGRFGKFFSCPNYPECKNTHKIEQKINMKCPDCGDGDVVIKKTRKGKTFYGCNTYPACEYASWKDPKQKK